MKIESTVTAYAQNAYMTGSAQETPASNSAPAAATAKATPVPSTSVSLSGKALMLSRLFGTTDPNATLPVLDGAHGMDRGNSGIQATNYLTENDRSVIADMYSYAQQQGTDLQYVDTLAVTLGRYRQSDNGRLATGGNKGTDFDSAGHQLSFSYSPADTATADRILNGNAINSTQLDRGFIRYILDPGMALGNTANISFMEQMVTKFSDQGTSATPLPAKFSSFSVNDMTMKNVVITASKEVVYKAPQSQIANIDGQWYVFDPSVMEDLDPSQRLSAQRNQPIVDSLLASQGTSKESLDARLLDLLGSTGKHGGKKLQKP